MYSSLFASDKEWYWRSARQLLAFSRRYLTAEAMAAYVARTMGIEGSEETYFKSDAEEEYAKGLRERLRRATQRSGGGNTDAHVPVQINETEQALLMKRVFRRRILIVSPQLHHQGHSHPPSASANSFNNRPVTVTPTAACDGLLMTLVSGFTGIGYEVAVTTSDDERGLGGSCAASEEELLSLQQRHKPQHPVSRRCEWLWTNRVRGGRVLYQPKQDTQLAWLENKLFDAVIFYFPSPSGNGDDEESSPQKELLWRFVSRARWRTGGKVAAVHAGGWGADDPQKDAGLLDKHMYFFSQELRRVYC